MSAACCAGRCRHTSKFTIMHFLTELYQKDLLGSVHFGQISCMQSWGLRIKHWQKLIKLLIDNIWWYGLVHNHVIVVSTGLWDTKCMMTIIGLVHMKCIRNTQLIIKLVHLNIVGISTWNYMVMNIHEMNSLLKHGITRC